MNNRNVVLGVMAMCSAVFMPTTANAATLDGIKTIGDGYTDSFTFNWHNNHEPDGTAFPLAGSQTTEAYWKTSGDSFYLYLEVPAEAKNAMWGTALLANSDELDAYFGPDNTHYHHSPDKIPDKAQYKTMTESEHFEFGSDQLVSWDPDSGKQTTSGDWDNVVTSLEWVLANGCDKDSCDRIGTPMAFEAEYLNFSEQDRLDLIAEIQGSSVVLHLSDERQGPVSTVPVPAALPLFASALIGLLGFARRRAIAC